MRHIKELSPIEMRNAEKYYEKIANERKNLGTRTYRDYSESRGRPRTSKKSRKIKQATPEQIKKIKEKEYISFYHICIAYQKTVKCGNVKISKDIRTLPYCLNYMYTKGWLKVDNIKMGNKIQTNLYIKKQYIKDFLAFYKKTMR